MKRKHTKKIVRYKASELPRDIKTNWKRVDSMSSKELEENAKTDANSLLADDEFWHIAQLVMPSEINKERITIRIDADVLNWLKHKGRGYQSRINTILRAFMQTSKKHHHGHSSYKHSHR